MIALLRDRRNVRDGVANPVPLGASKACHRYLRAALYMPALSAHQHDPHIKAYFQHLVATNGKEKMQALCAVMRKLLHAIHGMLKKDEPFDNTRFYKIPASAG